MSILIDGFEVDVALTEDPLFDSEVTKNPVEQGSAVADHQIIYPVELTIEGFVSDTPVGAIADRRGTEGFPSIDAYAFLKTVMERKEPVTVETTRDVFDNMLLQSLAPQTDTNDGFRFRATFQQIDFHENERTTVPVATPRAGKKVKRGAKVNQFGKEIPDPETGRVTNRLDPNKPVLPTTVSEEAAIRGYPQTQDGYDQMMADNHQYYKRHGRPQPRPFPSSTGFVPILGPPAP